MFSLSELYYMNKVQKEKTNCYPDSINSSDSFISTSLQDFMNHTTKRIILSQNDAITTYREKSQNNN